MSTRSQAPFAPGNKIPTQTCSFKQVTRQFRTHLCCPTRILRLSGNSNDVQWGLVKGTLVSVNPFQKARGNGF